MKPVSCNQRNGGHRLRAQEPHRALLGIIICWDFPAWPERNQWASLLSTRTFHPLAQARPPGKVSILCGPEPHAWPELGSLAVGCH